MIETLGLWLFSLTLSPPLHPTCKAMWALLGSDVTQHLRKEGGGVSPSRVCDVVAYISDQEGLEASHSVAVAYAESGFHHEPGHLGGSRYKTAYRGPMQVHRRYCEGGVEEEWCVRDGVRALLHWREVGGGTWRWVYAVYVGLYVPGLREENPRAYKNKLAYINKVERWEAALRTR